MNYTKLVSNLVRVSFVVLLCIYFVDCGGGGGKDHTHIKVHIPEIKHKHTHVNTKYIHIFHKKKQAKAKPKHYIHSRNDPTIGGHHLGGGGGGGGSRYNTLVNDFRQNPDLLYIKSRKLHHSNDDNTEKVYRNNHNKKDPEDYHYNTDGEFDDIHIPKYSNDFKPSAHVRDSGENYQHSAPILVKEEQEEDDYDLQNEHNMPWGFVDPKTIPFTPEHEIKTYTNFAPSKPYKYNTNIGNRYTNVNIDKIGTIPESDGHTYAHIGSYYL